MPTLTTYSGMTGAIFSFLFHHPRGVLLMLAVGALGLVTLVI